jgi:hypothetical protein
MPTNKKLFSKTLILIKIALSLIIMILLFYIILIEQPLIKEKIYSKNLLDSITKTKYCEEAKTLKYLEVMFKCFLAFFSGCLLSEIKFLKTGVI